MTQIFAWELKGALQLLDEDAQRVYLPVHNGNVESAALQISPVHGSDKVWPMHCCVWFHGDVFG